MEGDPKIFDPVFVVEQILQGRSDDEITIALVQRGTDAKTALEFVKGLRKTIQPQGISQTPGQPRTRDKRLQRLLLLSARDRTESPELSTYSQEQRAYNSALLINDGLAQGEAVQDINGEYVLARLIEITSKGHDFLDQTENTHRAPVSAGPAVATAETKDSTSAKPAASPSLSKLVFVSHSSLDKDLAEALVDMLCSALNLRRRDFLCTSVEGAKLRGGDVTDDELRRQIREAPAFLSLLTREAVSSTYVLFELGARWGCAKHHIPLLAKGAGTEVLREPLKATNALQMSRAPDVLQLVEDLGHLLNVRPEPANSYLEKVQHVVRISSTAVSTGGQTLSETPKATNARKEVVTAASFRVHSELRIVHNFGFPQLALATWLANDGHGTANDVKIICFNAPQVMSGFDHNLWKEGGSASGGQCLLAKAPIHPGEMPGIVTWTLGQAQILVDGQTKPAMTVPSDIEKTPLLYTGPDIAVRFKIFAHNQTPTEVSVQFSKEEVRRLRAKDSVPT
jgi:hypothetical protein